MSKSLNTSSVRRFKSYSTLKDSGIEWLGSVPDTWEIKRVRAVLRDRDGIKIGPFGSALKSDIIQEKGYKVYGQEHVISGDFQIGEKYVDKNKFAELAVCEIIPGDLVVSMMGTTGKCQVVPPNIERGIMDSHLLRLRPKENVHPQLLARLINESEYIRYQVSTNSKGSIMEGLNSSIIKNLSLLLPSLDEQRAIAAFIDREMARIDQLIAKKERQIELLQEKRSSLISHAVTKGLKKGVQMKDSGIEWLGQIPEHWKVKKLKFITNQIIDGTHLTPTYVDEGVPFLRVTDIHTGDINFDEVKRIPREEHNDLIKRCHPAKGDLLVSKNGTIGVPCVVTWNEEFSIFVSLCLIKVTNAIDVSYAKYFFLSNEIREQIHAGGKMNTIINLHLDKIREFVFALPPVSEQRNIALFLDKELRHHDTMAEKINKSIDLLREYRNAIISAAVTGKINVMEEAA